MEKRMTARTILSFGLSFGVAASAFAALTPAQAAEDPAPVMPIRVMPINDHLTAFYQGRPEERSGQARPEALARSGRDLRWRGDLCHSPG